MLDEWKIWEIKLKDDTWKNELFEMSQNYDIMKK